MLKLTDKLGGYIAQGKEVNLANLLRESIRLNKHCYAPVIKNSGMDKSQMKFHQFNSLPQHNSSGNLWRSNIYGIKEPYLTPSIDAWKLDVVFMPLVAFDDKGGRLGMGGGYYDRAFEFCRDKNKTYLRKPLLIGVAYDCQRVNKVPLEAVDIKLDAVVTESGWQKF